MRKREGKTVMISKKYLVAACSIGQGGKSKFFNVGTAGLESRNAVHRVPVLLRAQAEAAATWA
jgi:hypothetical protein